MKHLKKFFGIQKFLSRFSVANLNKKLDVIVHLFYDLDEIRNELFLDTIMTYISYQIPNTDPMTDILVAAFNFKEGLSLFSYSM